MATISVVVKSERREVNQEVAELTENMVVGINRVVLSREGKRWVESRYLKMQH